VSSSSPSQKSFRTLAPVRLKFDAIAIVLAVLAVVCLVVGGVIVSGHLKRGLLAFAVGVVLAGASVFAAVRAGQRSHSSPHR
jgi:hypothetical protein